MSAKIRSNEIKITRIYAAPIEAVWNAWIDPEQAAKWWGPRGFTITTHYKDLRPGGSWSYTMHGPDGVDYPNKTYYYEVIELSKLIYDHGSSDERPPLFRVTVEFSEENGKTRMEMSMLLPTPEAAEETRKFIKKAGGDATWDRLAEYLEKTASGKEKFVINRSFDAPIELMFQLWTDPQHISKWLPPDGFAMQFLQADIKPEGKSHYMMIGGNGVKMYGKAAYIEIETPATIVYTQQFCDEDQEITRHPLAPIWPETMLTTVKLTAEGPDRTRVTVTWEPYGPTTAEELQTFINGRAGMAQGWTGSFDKLDAYLSSIR